ncbi:MAG: DNA mismatch repair protein MutL [Ktedonobacterales bacterium]|jgi:DNA mismatch repair protein MutL|nr:MAG: DNA mismatch repair protein MutL [Ktedonobacterales bacterium]
MLASNSGEEEHLPVNSIARLPADVIERIAAGEVIERPASVARELVENALDAGAKTIRVEMRDGGLLLIRVADDGCGILRDDLELVCQPHATSKVRSLADLDTITTLGFRGEALASIAAVAEVEFASATDDLGMAHSVTVNMGRRLTNKAQARSRGTTVTVRNIFAAVPARRALLRGAQGEALRVFNVIRAYALIHPGIRFTLVSDGHLLLQTQGTTLEEAIIAIYGTDVARAMVPLVATDTSEARLSGAGTSRSIHFATREHVIIAINGRVVVNHALQTALETGYRPLMRKGRHPLLIASWEVSPERVDANVHPAKIEVLLQDENALARALRKAVAEAIGHAPTSAVPHTHWGEGRRFARPMQLALPAPRTRRGLLLRKQGGSGTPQQAQLEADTVTLERPLTLVSLGQFEDTLLLAYTPDGDLYLVDQHRAHERVIYEQLLRQRDAVLAKKAPAQGQLLLSPLLIELTPRQAELLLPRLDELASCGVEYQPFGGSSFLVRSLPAALTSMRDPAGLIKAVTHEATEESEHWLDGVCVALACRTAIRRGQPLSSAEQRALLVDFCTVNVPALCPHGSPLLLRYSKGMLAKVFEW